MFVAFWNGLFQRDRAALVLSKKRNGACFSARGAGVADVSGQPDERPIRQ